MKRRSRSGSVGSIIDITLEANENLSKDEEVKTKKHKLGLLKKHLIDYSANSNLHGLKYIGEKDRTLFENKSVSRAPAQSARGLHALRIHTELVSSAVTIGAFVPLHDAMILLHNPAELPRLSKQYFRAPLSHEVVVAVKPNMMTTSKGLKSLDSSRRQCYFPTERFLQYFKIYTQANCEIECLSNFTYARCGCVHFGMP
ncbi:putative pickpocket, partial [Danaus plexippus plexippus]